MGLDMYLYSKLYTKNWDHTKPGDRWTITIQKGAGPVDTINPTYVTEEVGYWRKANAIHKWFVDNAQAGEDSGGTYYVDRDKLQELLDATKKVLEGAVLDPNAETPQTGPDGLPLLDAVLVLTDETVAKELLPTQSGFFFGDLEYNQWYVNDLRTTERILTKALALPEDHDFEYHASW